MIQHLSPLEVQTYDYEATAKKIKQYEKMLNSPYFARIDFSSKDFGEETIYIGVGTIRDESTFEPLVYDWRAPISSIFYRYELGEVSYQAPSGTITGEVSLKRQYEIKDGKLIYFFDNSLRIVDDILKRVLSKSTSSKMKTIVETIQREQDLIIRDIDNDLVIIQGVAGSGKTSIALHRIAFLMYQGLTSKLNSSNVLFISPNALFSGYISNVLPELGEENISTMTFEDIFSKVFNGEVSIKSRNETLERIIIAEDECEKQLLKSSLKFKTSDAFLILLDRFIQYYERRLIEFSDIFYNRECIAHRHLLKAELLNSQKRSIPIQKRLELIETKITQRIHELKKERMKVLEKFVYEKKNHTFDIKAFARLLSLKENAALMKQIYSFTRIDYLALYKRLFSDVNLFYRLCHGLDLPSNIMQIFQRTKERLRSDELEYEDAMGLLCLRLKMDRCDIFSEIKQVLVDEVQDYSSLHFEILKHLFPNAKYTILGDINQTIEKNEDLTLYDRIRKILNRRRSTTLFLNKSFRCSYEINTFSLIFTDGTCQIESFDRHEAIPTLIGEYTDDNLNNSLLEEIRRLQKSGYSSIAIICKSMEQAKELHENIKSNFPVQLISEQTEDTISGIMVLPIYMAKGLEVDAVLVYGVGKEAYHTEDDKRLLYIACTRALHHLCLLHKDQVCEFISSYSGDLERKGKVYM